MYRQWPQLMPATIEPIGIQLPGRADRFTEPAHERIITLLDDLIDVAKPLLEQPFACYGISMGARVAWAFAHALRDRAMPLPSRLFVACVPRPAPTTAAGRGRAAPTAWRAICVRWVAHRSRYWTSRNSWPLLPTLRSDLTLLSTHDFQPATPLDLPMGAFAGVDDPIADPERMAHWHTETTAGFELHRLPGGHFLTADAEHHVVQTIVRDLI